MYDIEIEMHNCEKFLEDQRVCINSSYHASGGNMKYSRNQIFVWLDKYKKNFRVKYFVNKFVEDGHMAKPYEPWSSINRAVAA